MLCRGRLSPSLSESWGADETENRLRGKLEAALAAYDSAPYEVKQLRREAYREALREFTEYVMRRPARIRAI
jgi:hypothetical protein